MTMTIQVKAFSLDMAKKMANAVEQKATELGCRVVLAMMDNHGNLKAFRRMDGSDSISIRMAQLKALTSASMPISTKDLAARNQQLANGPYLAIPDIILLEGGLPIITADGQHIGSIGISGATPEKDGIIAAAALAAIEDDLRK
jgi:glc operon protein GlcG